MLYCSLLFLSSKKIFEESHSVWIQIRPRGLSGLTLVRIVCEANKLPQTQPLINAICCADLIIVHVKLLFCFYNPEGLIVLLCLALLFFHICVCYGQIFIYVLPFFCLEKHLLRHDIGFKLVIPRLIKKTQFLH